VRALLLATMGAMVLASARVLACDCVTLCPLNVAAMRGSWATYVGRVVAAEPGADGRLVSYRIAPDRIWKGPRRKEFRVQAGGNAASCGYPLTVGERYLVVAEREDEQYGYCDCHPEPLTDSVREAMRHFDKDRGWSSLALWRR
jgi:hypothetical protein